MKKVLLVASIASALSLFNVAQAASGGTITFNGEITDATCDVVVDGGNANATVTLPTVSKSALNTTAGTVKAAGPKDFNLNLSNCASTSKLKVAAYFKPDSGNNVSLTTGNLYNTGTAKDVQVRLKYKDGGLIDINNNVLATGSSKFVAFGTTTPVTGGQTILTYQAEYVTAGDGSYNKSGTDALAAGTVVAQVEYELQYD